MPKENRALRELEQLRDVALAKIKDRASKIRAILDQRESFLKESYAQEQEELKAKARESAAVTRAQQALDRIQAKIPTEIERDLSRREAEIRSIESRKATHERELHGVKHDLGELMRRGTRDQVAPKMLRDQAVALEGLIAEAELSLDESKKGLDAARTSRREFLEGLQDEARSELAALGK